jgi:hypothetical protein
LSSIASGSSSKTLRLLLGNILGWHLLLFTVSKEAIGPHHAWWETDKKVLIYGDVDLHIDHVPQLLLSKFKQAQHLLYDELILGAQGLPMTHPWTLKGNVDIDAFDWFFSQYQENAELLKPINEVFANCYPRLKAATGFLPGYHRGWH